MTVQREKMPGMTCPHTKITEQNEYRDKRNSEDISGDGGRTTFELFRTYDGDEYTVFMRDDGKRFYVDFEEQV